ncbi:MAG: phosphonate metabolism protein/1,5-bisphosphokinase (PRPP-forming) PhnN [Pseudomonadota bacterium]
MSETSDHHSLRGRVILIVGPSGAGKDAVIQWLKPQLKTDPNIVFVRRTITRAAGDTNEDHIATSQEDFRKAEQSGQFLATWSAHGLFYGLSADLHDAVESGRLLIINGARRALPELKRVFPGALVVHITAKQGVLEERLRSRARENEAEIQERLQDALKLPDPAFEAVVIDNSGPIDRAGSELLALVRNEARQCLQGDPV